MKYLLTSIFLLCVAVLFAQKEMLDKVIVTVGGEMVLLSEVEEQVSYTKSQRAGALPPNARCAILEQLMVNKLLLNQAKLDSIVVKDEDVESQLTARIEKILSYMNGDLKQFEDYYGQGVPEVKEQFRQELKAQLLVEKIRAQVMEKIAVTPSEVRAFFQKIPKDSLPYFNSEVEIGEIVHKPVINKEQKRLTIGKLDDIRKRIVEGGEDFAALAQKYSDDGSARAGGDLGWAKRGKYVSDFEAAAYKLQDNEVSPVIQTQFGFHLLQMLGRRGNSIHVRHILIRPEVTEEDLAAARHYLDSVRMLILHDSISFSYAVKRFGHKEAQSFNNDGRMVNPSSGNTFFETGDLDPDIYFTVDTMKVGKISKPVEYTDPSGDIYYRIIQLQTRTPPHRASLAIDYSKIQKAAIESKRNETINKWVTDRIGKTFVSFDREISGCPSLDVWVNQKSAKPKP